MEIKLYDIFVHLALLFSLGTIAISDYVPNITGDGHKLINDCNDDGCGGRLWIYYSDVNRTSQWGTISDNGFSDDAKKIACKQLGYSTIDSSSQPSEHPQIDDSIPIWLYDFSACNKADLRKYNNLLECEPTLCIKSPDRCPSHDHTSDVYLHCAQGKQTICMKVCMCV